MVSVNNSGDDIVSFIDVESGRKYYFSPSTGKCAWDPAELKLATGTGDVGQSDLTALSESSTTHTTTNNYVLPASSPRRIPAKAMARASRSCSVADDPPQSNSEMWASRSLTNTAHKQRRESRLILDLHASSSSSQTPASAPAPVAQRFTDPATGHEYVVDPVTGQTQWVTESHVNETPTKQDSAEKPNRYGQNACFCCFACA
jgi:hypothetical protein